MVEGIWWPLRATGMSMANSKLSDGIVEFLCLGFIALSPSWLSVGKLASTGERRGGAERRGERDHRASH